MNFITHKGIFQPTRITQSIMKGGSNLSSRVEPCFQAFWDRFKKDPVKAWMDDFLLHAPSVSELLESL